MLWCYAFLSAFLLWASFPPVNFGPLAWAALLPWLLALDKVSSRLKAFRLSYAVGLLFFLFSLQWIHFVTSLGLLLLALYLALYFAVAGLVYYLFRSSDRFWARVLVWPSFWVLLEYIRSVAFTGFGWGAIGYSQAGFGGLLPLAGFTGVAGISFLLVLANVILKELSFGQRSSEARCLAAGLALIIGAALIHGVWAVPPRQTKSLKVALIQPNISLRDAWNPLKKTEIVETQLELSRQAMAQKPRLIVWPETSFPQFIWERTDLFDKISAFARDNQVFILFGTVVKRDERYFNAAVLVDPAGLLVGIRAKRHLVVFGEYIPFRKQFPFLQDLVPIDDFSPGDEDALFDVPGLGKFGVLICFEDTVPEIARDYVAKGASFLVNMTNDAWFQNSGQQAMHLNNALFRTVENARPLLRATNTGESCAIGADGLIRGCVQDNQGHRVQTAGFVVTSVDMEDHMNWYTKCGWWVLVLCGGIVLAFVLANFRRRKSAPLSGGKILLIDDDRAVHTMLKSVFAANGYEVVSAMSGEEGLLLAESERPGLILLDVILPKMKGREVCKRLKASHATAAIPVLFLTAKDSDDDVKAEMAVGAVGHVTKPINSNSLLRLVKKTLSS